MAQLKEELLFKCKRKAELNMFVQRRFRKGNLLQSLSPQPSAAEISGLLPVQVAQTSDPAQPCKGRALCKTIYSERNSCSASPIRSALMSIQCTALEPENEVRVLLNLKMKACFSVTWTITFFDVSVRVAYQVNGLKRSNDWPWGLREGLSCQIFKIHFCVVLLLYYHFDNKFWFDLCI